MRDTLLLVSLLVLVITPAHAGKIYRWVDSQGHVTYQDAPPPPGARDVRIQRMASSSYRPSSKRRPSVTLYMIPNCPPCDSVRRYLDRRGVPFSEVNIAHQPKERAVMKRTTGYVSVPTVVVGKTAINGFNPGWLGSELTKAGYKQKPAHPKKAK